MSDRKKRRSTLWIAAAILLALAVFMYVSIMVKIVTSGP